MKPPICTTPSSWLSPWNTTKTYTYGAWELLSARLRAGSAQLSAEGHAQPLPTEPNLCHCNREAQTPHQARTDQESPPKAAWTVLKTQLFESQVLRIIPWFQLINLNVVLQRLLFFLLEKDSVSLIMTTLKIPICTHSHYAKFKTIQQNKHQTVYIGLR